MTTLRELYRADQLPVFQNRMYPTAEAARSCARGDVVLVEDQETGLVHNAAFRAELMVYDKDYQNEQGNSRLFQQHLEAIAGLVERTMGKERIVEVGCGKELFLEMLAARGFDIAGFDPTYEGNNPRVVKQYFSAELGMRGDGLVLRHVLEHIQNPVDFLFQLKDANGGGLIYIEVPCFEWICQNRTWFDIFYEHVNYFRLSDFQRMFGTVLVAEHSFGGQYLSVVADLATLRRPKADPADAARFPADFLTTLTPRSLGNAVVWGGASKGVLFCLMMERQGVKVGRVIDINPAKQGKFLAATGIEVSSPDQVLDGLPNGATIYVMNSNYLPEIREMSGDRFNYVGIDHE